MRIALPIVTVLAAASAASAGTITFEFEGSVTGIVENTIGADVSGGTEFVGIYSFESDAPATPVNPFASRYDVGVPHELHLTIAGLRFSEPVSYISVFNDAVAAGNVFDYYHMATRTAGDIGYSQLNLRALGREPPLFLNSQGLPSTPPDLSLADYERVFAYDGDGIRFVGNVTSLRLVPLPPTAWLGLGLLGGIGLAGRLRRRSA